MTPASRLKKLSNYIFECAHLLYWIYFQPYTLKKWLQQIDPDLQPNDNPYLELKKNPHNRGLQRYAGQVFWLTIITPQLAVFIVGVIYFVTTKESFDWLDSETFLLGWAIGQIILRFGSVIWGSKFQFWALGVLILFIIVSQFLGGVASGVASGVTSGVAFGITLGVTSGVAFGVTFGVTFIFGVLRVYFWLPELLWMGWLFLSTSKGRFARNLKYLPPYYDQIIHLPLPFISTMIVKAYRENPAVARKTINYLINSTNQKQVATKATINIALDILARCATINAIAAIPEQLAWIPSYSTETNNVLPQLLDISRTVQSAEMATSPYRKSEILKQTVNSLTQLQTSLALVKNPAVANVAGNIVQSWLGILETAQDILKDQSRYAQEIPQVYIAGASLEPETAKNRFKGRQDLFREIENIALMSPPPTLLLYGNRRTGKTSTLKYLPQKLGGDLIPLLVDVHAIATAETLPGVARSLARQIVDDARISRNLTLRLPDKDDLRTDPFLTLQEWFTDIERTAPGKRFLLCLDEYERLEEVVTATNSRAPLNFLRHIIQHRAAWTLLFSGSHTLDEIDNYWSDYLISTRYIRLTYLEKSEAEELIIHPIPDFPDIYLPEAVTRIIYWTRCQPYLVQLLCSELVNYLNQQHSQNVLNIKATAMDIDNIIPNALVSGSLYFNEFWDQTLNSTQQKSLRNLIQHLNPTPEDQRNWNKLINKEILEYDENKRICFQVPLIERSITQKIAE